MEEVVREDIISSLRQASDCLRSGNASQMKSLSNKAISEASIYQDPDTVSFAVITYTMSKLMDQIYDFKKLDVFANHIDRCISYLQKRRIDDYRKCVKQLFAQISKLELGFKQYIDEVITRAQIKKGGSVIERGISVARAASLMGIGQWELMSFVGKTNIHEQSLPKLDVMKRLSVARELFS